MASEQSSGENPPLPLHTLEMADVSKAVVQTLDQLLLILTDDLVVADANPAFGKLFRVDAAETFGRRLYELRNGN